MIRLSTLWLATLLAGCGGTAASAPSAHDRLPWLVGTWQDDDGQATIVERWTASPDGDLLGSGYVRVGPQVLGFAETLAIDTAPDGGLVLTAWPVGQPPARFRITLEGSGALLAQREGDGFPQRLRYRVQAGEGASPSLAVTAEGPGPGQEPRTESFTLSQVDAEPAFR